MRSSNRLMLTMAGLALATFCWAQDPDAATQEQPPVSPTPVAAQPSQATDSSATTQPAPAPSDAPAAAPALPVAAPPDAATAPAPPAPQQNVAPAPVPDTTTAPSSHAATESRPKVKAPARRLKAEVKPSTPAQKDKDKAAEAAGAAAVSSEPPQSTAPPSDGSTAPAPTAANPALPPAAGLPDPLVGIHTETEEKPRHNTAWIPLSLLVLGLAGAVTLVARRRKDEEISILSHDDTTASAPRNPLPRHS